MIKHNGHLRTQRKCAKHELQASVSTFLKCCQMLGVFYPTVIHSFVRLLHLLRGDVVKNNRAHFFYVLYSNKTWVFDQSESVINVNK